MHRRFKWLKVSVGILDEPEEWAILLAILALMIGVGGYRYLRVLGKASPVVDDFYANVATELASIAITVLLIDRLNRRRSKREEVKRVCAQMASPDTQFAREAYRIARAERWFWDGTLAGADLKDVDLKGADLRRANLQRANLSRANLENADLGGATFTGANMVGANLRGATLIGVNLAGSDSQEANFTNAVLRSAWLQNSSLAGAIFTDADLRGASLARAELKGAWLSGATLRGADFADTDLVGANLSGADLTEANLQGCILRITNPENKWPRVRASLNDAILSGATLSNALYNTNTVWPADFSLPADVLNWEELSPEQRENLGSKRWYLQQSNAE